MSTPGETKDSLSDSQSTGFKADFVRDYQVHTENSVPIMQYNASASVFPEPNDVLFDCEYFYSDFDSQLPPAPSPFDGLHSDSPPSVEFGLIPGPNDEDFKSSGHLPPFCVDTDESRETTGYPGLPGYSGSTVSYQSGTFTPHKYIPSLSYTCALPQSSGASGIVGKEIYGSESMALQPRPECLLEDDHGIFIEYPGILTPPVSGGSIEESYTSVKPQTKVDLGLVNLTKSDSSDSDFSSISSIPSLSSCTSTSTSESFDISTPSEVTKLETGSRKWSHKPAPSTGIIWYPKDETYMDSSGVESQSLSSLRKILSNHLKQGAQQRPKCESGGLRPKKSAYRYRTNPLKTEDSQTNDEVAGLKNSHKASLSYFEESQNPAVLQLGGATYPSNTYNKSGYYKPEVQTLEALNARPAVYMQREQPNNFQRNVKTSKDLPGSSAADIPTYTYYDPANLSSEYSWYSLAAGAQVGAPANGQCPSAKVTDIDISSPQVLCHDEGYECKPLTSNLLKDNKQPEEPVPERSQTPDNIGGFRFHTPSSASPKPSDISTTSTSHHISLEDDDSGYQEERAVKVKALYILVQFFLLREYHLKSQSASTTPSSGSSSSAENCSDLQSERCENIDDQETGTGEDCNRCTKDSSPRDTESQDTQPSKSGSNPQKRKRRDHEDESKGEEDDKDDQQPNHKKSKNIDLNSLGARLACPFAKGKPPKYLECALIGRQDLSGVKEHLKRNHYEKILPSNIRACKTWEQVFRVCNPDWDYKNPIPSRYLDIGFQLVQGITGVPYPAGNLPLDSQVPHHLDSTNQDTVDVQNPVNGEMLRDIAATPQVLRSAIDQTKVASVEVEGGITQTDRPSSVQTSSHESQNSGETIGASENATMKYNTESIYPQNFDGQFAFPQGLNGSFKQLAAPHFIWPVGTESMNEFNAVPDDIFNEYGIDMNLPPKELYPMLQRELNVPGFDNTTTSFFPPSVSYTPVVAQRAPTQSVPSNSSAYTPGLTRNASDMSTATPFSTPSQPRSDSISNRYTLIVARDHHVPGSLEGQGPKLFDFDSYEDFRSRFEAWVSSTFTDPPFSWDTMEFIGADPKIHARLSNVNEVLLNLRMWHIRQQTSDATLYLACKDKGKQKALP